METLNQTHKSEDQVQLLLHRGSRKHRTPSGHFVEDAPNTPGGKQDRKEELQAPLAPRMVRWGRPLLGDETGSWVIK